MNVSWDRKVKKLAYLPEYWLDLTQIWCRGVFLDSKSKINKKVLNDMKVKYPYIVCRKCIWRHYDVTFCSMFLKTSIFLLFNRDYQHTKFGLIWVKESKVMERGAESAPPGWECIKSPRWDRVNDPHHPTSSILHCYPLPIYHPFPPEIFYHTPARLSWPTSAVVLSVTNTLNDRSSFGIGWIGINLIITTKLRSLIDLTLSGALQRNF